LETRVIGVLIDREITTPDRFPLSLNALTGGCSQKSNRRFPGPATHSQRRAHAAAEHRMFGEIDGADRMRVLSSDNG
jgi:uncharacterized protein YceH (UPF0502 family)